MNGGRMKYSGGTAIGATHEKYLLGTATFTGSGYIKMVYSGGWSKSNLVVPDTAVTPPETFLTHQAATAHSVTALLSPELIGFEVVGEVALTGGEMVLPDARITATNPLTFKVGEGAKLTIARGAILKTEDADAQTAAAITRFVVGDRANVEVAGELWIPVEAGGGGATDQASINNGTITVTETGILQNDFATSPTDATLLPKNNGTILIKGGGKVLYDRTAYPSQKVYISTGSSAERYKTTAAKTDIKITSDLLTITGDGAVAIIGTAPALVLPLAIDNKANVTVDDVLTGGTAPADTVTLTKGAKLTLKKAVSSTSITKLTATDSEVSFAAVGASTTIPGAVSLTNSTATFNWASAATMPTDIIPFASVTASKATINYRGGAAAGYTAVNTAKVIGGPEISKFTVDHTVFTLATNGLNIAGGTAEFNNLSIAALPLNVSHTGTPLGAGLSNLKVGGTLTATTGSVALNGGTAELNNVTTAATGTTDAALAFNLNGGSTVKIAGTATFTGAAPNIKLQDTTSTLIGTTNGVSKLTMTTGAGPLVYTAKDNASFVKLFEAVTAAPADGTTTVARNIAQNQAVIWNGKWGVPQ
jgi:hypothetical protein